jgi:hypothetical protein
MGTRVTLAVIDYIDSQLALSSSPRAPDPLLVQGFLFPRIVRPWLPVPHSFKTARVEFENADGNCWVGPREGPSEFRGLLTADHAIDPSIRRGLTATPSEKTHRNPPSGPLIHRSKVMDAAIIDTTETAPSLTAVAHSKVLGLKPVRMLRGGNAIEADVVEYKGNDRRTIPVKPGAEPLIMMLFLTNR